MSDPVVRDVIDGLPPSTWNVSLWRDDLANTFVNGRIDRADVHRIVGAVVRQLFVDGHRRPCRDCGAMTIVAVHDTGAPLPLEVDPAPDGWLDVWRDNGYLRVSGTNLGAHPDARRHHPHRCRPAPAG